MLIILFFAIAISGKTRAKRFWRKGHNACGKWSLHHANLEHFARKGTQQSLLPLNAKGKIRQKLINGLYESFCYSPRHALDFQPNNSDEFRAATSPLTVTVERHTSPERYPSRVCENLTTIDESLNENLLSSSTWHRANSWTTSASCTYSSGYSSANTSCPSSANSHRSTSPTPDFSNIKLLSATLEQYSGEENSYSGDNDLGILTEDEDLRDEFSLAEPCDFFATWPQKSRIQDKADRINKRIFSGKLSLLLCLFVVALMFSNCLKATQKDRVP